MTPNHLKHGKIPSSSGVYFFKDPKGRILYIGKAANLKNRLGSYKKTADLRIRKMLERAADLDWQETGSEIEALILESQLIKKYRPPFNIMLRDDKQYFFVGITHSTSSGQAKEELPRIFLTHQPNKTNWANNMPLGPRPMDQSRRSPASRAPSATGSKEQLLAQFVGPFTEGASLKTTLKLLKRIFPFCTCKQKHNRHCLNYHIGNCLGFCCLKNSPDRSVGTAEKQHYKKNIKAVRYILNGKKISVLKALEKEMNRLAKRDNFEKAIELRGKITRLQRVFENARVIKELAGQTKVLKELQKLLSLPTMPQRIEGYDISNIQGQFATGAMVVFSNGQPDKNEYRKFKIRTVPPDQGGDVAMLKEMLSRRFNHPEWQFPDLIVIDGGKGQLSTALSVVPKSIALVALTKDDRHTGSHIYQPNKKEPIALSKLSSAVRNLILHIDAEAHRFAISYYRKLHWKTIS